MTNGNKNKETMKEKTMKCCDNCKNMKKTTCKRTGLTNAYCFAHDIHIKPEKTSETFSWCMFFSKENKQYYEKANKRIQNELSQLTLF